jgi:hypothetical protein
MKTIHQSSSIVLRDNEYISDYVGDIFFLRNLKRVSCALLPSISAYILWTYLFPPSENPGWTVESLDASSLNILEENLTRLLIVAAALSCLAVIAAFNAYQSRKKRK